MKLLLAFPPFHPPTSAPLGLASLKATLASRAPQVSVELEDWNLALFRRWLLGTQPHLCQTHPDQLLGQVCPHLLVEGQQGSTLWADLCQLPETETDAFRYMRAAGRFDAFYAELTAFYAGMLQSYVEGRTALADTTLELLFSHELAAVEAAAPDLIGLSILAETNLRYALALARNIKERCGVPIALGGAMMSHVDAAELLRGFPWLDFIFFGEAENSLVDFLEAWRPGGPVDLEDVAGIAHRAVDGQPCVHPAAALPELAALPFADFSAFPLRDYLAPAPVLPILSSRGCYWGKCSFCSHTRPYGAGVRVRRPASVVDEMAWQAERHGVQSFLFVDEAIAPKSLRGIAQELSQRQLDFRWGAEGIRTERQFDAELLGVAHRAGLRWVYAGIESSNARLLELIDKGTRPDDVERFISACREVGITAQLSYIVGLPGTTREEIETEVAFFCDHPVDASPFVLLLGSPMQLRPGDFGIRVEDQEVLYSSVHGEVHAPRFFFTSAHELSPLAAWRLLQRLVDSRAPKLRPHIGEIHATLLADQDFFAAKTRPADDEPMLTTVMIGLERTRRDDPLWPIHYAACLEASGAVDDALNFVRHSLRGLASPTPLRSALRLHLVALCNRIGRPDLAIDVADDDDLAAPAGAALRGQLLRSGALLGRHEDVIAQAEALLKRGGEVAGLHGMLGESFLALGRVADALSAFQEAERRDWYNPALNHAQAVCLRELGDREGGRGAEEKAARKEKLLGS